MDDFRKNRTWQKAAIAGMIVASLSVLGMPLGVALVYKSQENQYLDSVGGQKTSEGYMQQGGYHNPKMDEMFTVLRNFHQSVAGLWIDFKEGAWMVVLGLTGAGTLLSLGALVLCIVSYRKGRRFNKKKWVLASAGLEGAAIVAVFVAIKLFPY